MNIIYNLNNKLKFVDEGKTVKPIIITVNKFNEESRKEFCALMNEAQSTDQDVIPILIDSYGGEVYSLLGMIDSINSSTKPVSTICIGKAMSCGAVLLSCGAENLRFMSENSTVLIHDVANWTGGKVEEIKADARNTDRLQNLIMKILDENCNQKEGYFQNLIHEKHHADWYLTADECLQHNLVDKIGLPFFEIETKLNITFRPPHK